MVERQYQGGGGRGEERSQLHDDYAYDNKTIFLNMRFRERLLYNILVNILPTVSFLVTLYLYGRQQRFYEQRIMSIGKM